MERTPQNFVEQLLKAPPAEKLHEDEAVTVPEMKEFLAEKLAETFRFTSDDLIKMSPVNGPVMIGLVIAYLLQKQYGQAAVKQFLLSIGEGTLRNKEKL